MSRSVANPDFKYTPSKNIYWEKLKNLSPTMQGLAFTDQDTEAHLGNWRKQFKNAANADARLHVEIGCNAGHVCLEWAKQNPDQRYIGIDYKFKQIYRLAEKTEQHKLQNLIAFRANAERLPFMFAPGEIDFIHMFFPDPWPKKAQMKNRTASAAWLKSLAPHMSTQGHFHLKTDHDKYFEYILEQIKELKDTYTILEKTHDLHASHPNPRLLTIPDVTLFEKLFIKEGIKIKSVKIKPR